MLDLKLLDEKQKEAVTTDLGPRLIVAGAGSGKTRVLTLRINYLIDHYQINPNKILAITFTNKAANEIKTRVQANNCSTKIEWIGTFHSICLKILRQDIVYLKRKNDFLIIDEEDKIDILKEYYKENDISVKELNYKSVLHFIEQVKDNHFNKQDVFNERNWKLLSVKNNLDCSRKYNIYTLYVQKCENDNLVDFNDLLILTNKLLKDFPQIYQKWANYFEYVLIDEFQDTNDKQYELVKCFVSKSQNIFAVGDPDQMIYTWRGANEEIINSFESTFPNSKVIILDTNYRSLQSILNVSNELIKNNKNKYQKTLNAAREGFFKPVLFNAINQDMESKWVINKILKLQEKNVSLKDICILYRSNYLSRNIEQELMINNLSYVIYGAVKFYQRKEVKDILAYLKAAFLRDELSFKRIINVPKRNIGQSTIDNIQKFANINHFTFSQALNNIDEIDSISTSTKKSIRSFINLINEIALCNSLSKAILKVVDATNFIDFLKANDEEYRIRNIEELINSIIQYEQDYPKNDISDYLQEVALYSEKDNNNQESISLMTIHLSKGLEFKYIFLIGFNDGILPSNKSINEPKLLEEERRVAYVAITRAQDQLYLSTFGGINYMTSLPNIPSRFLNEINNSLIDIDKTKLINLSKTNDDWYDSKQKINYQDNYNETNDASQYKIGDRVIHTFFQEGIIIGIKNDMLEISFKPPFNKRTIIANHKALKRKEVLN